MCKWLYFSQHLYLQQKQNLNLKHIEQEVIGEFPKLMKTQLKY